MRSLQDLVVFSDIRTASKSKRTKAHTEVETQMVDTEIDNWEWIPHKAGSSITLLWYTQNNQLTVSFPGHGL